MAHWIRDDAEYKFRQPGQNQDCRVHVTGILDGLEADRPKLLLEDMFDNRGPSIQDAPARDACIQKISAGLKFDPSDADWFTRDREGKLQSVSIGYEHRTQENPEYTRLLNNGEFTQQNKEEEKKFFPDVTVSELRTTVQPASQAQQRELAEAFREGHKNAAAQQYEPDKQDTKMAAHEYDLTQERMHIYDRDR